jgi:hypothetical protein
MPASASGARRSDGGVKRKQEWTQSVVILCDIAGECERLAGSGWTIHSIVPSSRVRERGVITDGAAIVAFKGEPGLRGGVPR